MLEIVNSTRFKKDYKRMKSRGKNMQRLQNVVAVLAEEKSLSVKHRDQGLIGNWAGRRECHIESDWLLIYTVTETNLILERTGSHSDLNF